MTPARPQLLLPFTAMPQESLIASKEASPSDDMLSRVIEGQLKPGLISRESLVAHAFLHLVAGNATVASMINLGLVSLLEHPDQVRVWACVCEMGERGLCTKQK